MRVGVSSTSPSVAIVSWGASAIAGAVDHPRALDDADAAAGQVELVGLQDAGMLGRLATDQGSARLPAPGRHAADELGDPDRVEAPDGDVIEECERLGAGAHDVVRAHRDKVDADGVEASDRRRDDGLGADAVGRGDEQRLPNPGGDRNPPAEPAQPADDLGSPGRVDVLAHELDGALAGIDVDTGVPVRRPLPRPTGTLTHQRSAMAAPRPKAELRDAIRPRLRRSVPLRG